MDILTQYGPVIATLPEHEQREILRLINELEKSNARDGARTHFLKFVKVMWPDFVEGVHHRMIAKLFDQIVDGTRKRIIINMPPRHTKSEFASIYLPAFFLGRYPKKKVIQTSHTADLAVGFGRKVRNIFDRNEFHELFPGVSLSADSKAAGRWATNQGGEYFAIGAEGAIAGKGADLFIIDDPHSEQDAVIGESNPAVYDRVMSWYEGGPRQRLQPGAAIVIVMTRWSLRDLTGQLLKKQRDEPDSDRWKVIELPAILPINAAEGRFEEKPIWPQYWKLEELLRTKNSIPISKWNAQYQQTPVAEEGALIKREYWQDWTEKKPPKCETIIQSWDTAFTSNTRSDYSACTTWGIFWDATVDGTEVEEDMDLYINDPLLAALKKNKLTGKGKHKLILLDAVRGKWEFPELKTQVKALYREHQPDICLIEERGAGQPLVHELRTMNIPVQGVTVGRGGSAGANDKISRVNAISDIFASKMVYAIRNKTWAQEVIEECAAFPAGEHDDYVDTVTMALARFRQGGWIGTSHDEEPEEKAARRKWDYY